MLKIQPNYNFIEVNLVLEALYQISGYDFSLYNRSTVERRLELFSKERGYDRISSIIPSIFEDSSTLMEVIGIFSVPVSDMFRDPEIFSIFIQKVLPQLTNMNSIKIWHAGCAHGEEPYALAIILEEAGLLDRCTIYATDYCKQTLEKAKTGSFPLAKAREWSAMYQKAGGKHTLSEYYSANTENNIIICDKIRSKINFIEHNLVADQSIGQMQLILIRNVLIYFNPSLQEKVLELMRQSLTKSGYLWLGDKETLQFTKQAKHFEEVERKSKIFQYTVEN